MIPDKKKSAEEIAELRNQLGISETMHMPHEAIPSRPLPAPPPPPTEPAPPEIDPLTNQPIIHLKIAPMPIYPVGSHHNPTHTLRKHEPPLAPATHSPAPPQENKPHLPSHRRDEREIAELRRREQLALLASQHRDHNPAERLRAMTAHPLTLIVAYISALSAAAATWQQTHFSTPASLLILATLLTLYIFFAKKRSRHHTALLAIIIILTAVFGTLYYFPFLQYAS